MKLMRILCILSALTCTSFGDQASVVAQTALRAAAAQATEPTRKYVIYCIKGKVEVEYFTAQELEKRHGVKPCVLVRAAFTSMTVAQKVAKKFGGVGAPCRCKTAAAS